MLGWLPFFHRARRNSSSSNMGQCGSTAAAVDPQTGGPSNQGKRPRGKRGAGSTLAPAKVFHLEVDATTKVAEAQQPSSPVIAAAPSSQSEELELRASNTDVPQPSSACATSATRARRLSLPGSPAPAAPPTSKQRLPRSGSRGSSSGSLVSQGESRGSSAESEGEGGCSSARSQSSSGSGVLPAALSAQPCLPEAHPLPQRRVRFDQSPTKAHRYEVPAEEEEGEEECEGKEQARQAEDHAAAAAAAPGMAAAATGSPTKSALAAELLHLRQQQQQPALSGSGSLGSGGSLLPAGCASPSRAAAVASVQMRDLLHSVASLSRAGREPAARKQNQDNCFAYTQYCRPNQALMAALDGHGPNGHLVSGFLKKHLPLVLAEQLGESRSGAASCTCEPASCSASFTSSSTACSTSGGGGAAPTACSCRGSSAPAGGGDAQAALSASFLQVDEALAQVAGVDIRYSGSTAVVCMLRGRRLTTAWVGDSKAVLARQEPRGCRAIPLTRDHKPNHPEERARIAATGGRVERLVDHRGLPVGPDRVWLPTSWVPGLAMSRALGDAVAHSVGVSSEPETCVVEVCPQDKFLILATDGVWEFIDPQAAVDIVEGCKDAEEACRTLVDTAWAKWLCEEEGVVDDITVVCVKFNP